MELYNGMKFLASIIHNSPRLSSLDLLVHRYLPDGLPAADMDAAQSAFASLPQGQFLNLNHLSIGNTASLDLITAQTFPPFWRSLTSLVIHCDSSTSTSRQFWYALQKDRVYLKTLSTVVSHEMLQYLASFSGLEKLILKHEATESTESGDGEAQNLARLFYTSVLPKHVSSLVHISTSAMIAPSWHFGEHVAAPICACQRLATLKVSVHVQAFADVVRVLVRHHCHTSGF